MTYGQLPTEHLASTGKQFDPTLRLVMIPRSKNEMVAWKGLDMDQLARTATPRASES